MLYVIYRSLRWIIFGNINVGLHYEYISSEINDVLSP